MSDVATIAPGELNIERVEPVSAPRDFPTHITREEPPTQLDDIERKLDALLRHLGVIPKDPDEPEPDGGPPEVIIR
jgi:hypothetical protein